MLEIKNLNKKYSENIGNIDINLKINDGEVYAIVGPNGAGKTTLIRQILGAIKSDSGEISIDGFNPWINREKIMEFTGYVAGEISLFNELKGITYLKYAATFKKDVDWEFVEKLIKHFDIDTKRKIKKMSKGMKQKIALIAAMMGKPKFLVLDEPTSGLDPVMKDAFEEIITILKRDFKTTIIICSHIFEEVVKLSDAIGFIKDGKLIEEFKVIESSDIEFLSNKFKSLYEREKVF